MKNFKKAKPSQASTAHRALMLTVLCNAKNNVCVTPNTPALLKCFSRLSEFFCFVFVYFFPNSQFPFIST